MFKKHLTAAIWGGLLWLAMPVYASRAEQTINNIMVPVSLFAKAIHAACYILGIAFLMSGFMQYKQHRQNPQQVRLSTPIFLAFAGIVTLFLPWLMSLSGGL